MSTEQKSFFSGFFRPESAGGIILMLAAVLALLCANIPWQSYYALLIDTPVEIRIGALEIARPPR